MPLSSKLFISFQYSFDSDCLGMDLKPSFLSSPHNDEGEEHPDISTIFIFYSFLFFFGINNLFYSFFSFVHIDKICLANQVHPGDRNQGI